MAIIPEKTAPQQRDTLKTTEVMKYFHIGHGTLNKWMAKGAPYHIIDGTRWFSITEIEKWVSEQ